MALGLLFVFGRYIHFGFVLGGTRRQEGGKNTAIIGWTVLIFFRVGMSPLVGRKTIIVSLVGKVVVFTRPGPAAGAGCSGGGALRRARRGGETLRARATRMAASIDVHGVVVLLLATAGSMMTIGFAIAITSFVFAILVIPMAIALAILIAIVASIVLVPVRGSITSTATVAVSIAAIVVSIAMATSVAIARTVATVVAIFVAIV